MRPPEISSISIAPVAASIGVRMNAYAMPVPSFTRFVAAAIAAEPDQAVGVEELDRPDRLESGGLLRARGVDLAFDVGARQDQSVFHRNARRYRCQWGGIRHE